MLPAATGVPSGSPVSAAASRLTPPHSSCGQTSRGSASPGATDSAHSSIQALRVDVVERRPLAGAVVVEDVLAGEARDAGRSSRRRRAGSPTTPPAPRRRASGSWVPPTGSRAASRSGRGSRPRPAPRSAARPGRSPSSRSRRGSRAAADARPHRPRGRTGRGRSRPTARTRAARPASTRRHASTAPPHQSRSASCSAQPGRGREMPCSMRASATTAPSASTSTRLGARGPDVEAEEQVAGQRPSFFLAPPALLAARPRRAGRGRAAASPRRRGRARRRPCGPSGRGCRAAPGGRCRPAAPGRR